MVDKKELSLKWSRVELMQNLKKIKSISAQLFFDLPKTLWLIFFYVI